MHRKDENQENEKETDLRNTVAGIGAKIQALQIDVDSVKGHFSELKDAEAANKEILTKLQSNQNTVSSSNHMDNRTLEMIRSLNDQFTNRIQNVSLEFAKMNDTLSQKSKSLDDEQRSNKVRNSFSHD